MKCKIGDTITFKSWEKMLEEYGLNNFGSIKCNKSFTDEMEKVLNKNRKHKIIEVVEECNHYRVNNFFNYLVSDDMIEHIDRECFILNFDESI
jgi:hypothetical protein